MVYNGQSIYKWAYLCSKPWAPWLPEAVEMDGQRLAAVFVRATQGQAMLPYLPHLPYPVDPMVSKVVDMRRALRLTSQVLRCWGHLGFGHIDWCAQPWANSWGKDRQILIFSPISGVFLIPCPSIRERNHTYQTLSNLKTASKHLKTMFLWWIKDIYDQLASDKLT